MNNQEETVPANSNYRRNLVYSFGVLTLVTAIASAKSLFIFNRKAVVSCKPESSNRTMKMLTQDGRLVEVDESMLGATRKKVTDDELRDWIKK